MTDLPAEIWLHISQFIPDNSLQSMIGINRTFFEMAMDARYKVISFTSLSLAEIKIIERLADPRVAHRVRSLHLRLNLSPTHFREPPRTMAGTLRRRLKVAFQTARLLHPDPVGSPTEVKSSYTKGISSQEFYEILADVFPGMCNIEEFTFNSWNWPSDFDVQPFFLAAWPVFKRTLRKLSLGGNLEEYRRMLVSRPSLDCLRELELEFTDNIRGSNPVADAAILLDSVAPLVAHVSTQLTSLKLWSWASIDLSTFFKKLGPFPTLRQLGIRAAFNRSLKDDPSGLARLLSDSSPTLQQLGLRFDLATGLVHPSAELPLAEWLLQTIANDSTISTGLRTLELYPTGSPSGFEVLLVCIQRSVSTLTRLVVRNRYLQFGEVEAILQLFSSQENPPLTSLRLNILSLNADFFDLLGNSLPELQYLTLNIGDIMDGDLMAFKQAIESRSFPGWKLYDIDIWQGGSQLDGAIMLSIAKSIPSIQSFWTEGHM